MVASFMLFDEHDSKYSMLKKFVNTFFSKM